jgi:anti-anti-sigma factor
MLSTGLKNLEVSQSTEVGTWLVRLLEPEYGSLDAERLATLRDLLLELASDHVSGCLIVDVSNVQFFGAGFMGVLVDAWNRLRKRGRRLALCGLSPFCDKLIRRFRLDTLLDIYPTQGAALQDTGQSGKGRDQQARTGAVRIRISEVGWDPNMLCLTYIGDDDVPIRSVIHPRQRLCLAKIVAETPSAAVVRRSSPDRG